jgi:hypothetical protein
LGAPVNDIVGMSICVVEALIDCGGVVVVVDRNGMLNQLRQGHIYAFFSRHGAEGKKGASRGEDKILLPQQVLSEFDVYQVNLVQKANASRVENRDSLGMRGCAKKYLLVLHYVLCRLF